MELLQRLASEGGSLVTSALTAAEQDTASVLRKQKLIHDHRTGFELTRAGWKRLGVDRPDDTLASLIAALLAILLFLGCIGESLDWWNLRPLDPKRGDWNQPH